MRGLKSYIRFGSKPKFSSPQSDVRFAPEAAVHPGSLFLRPDNKKQKATRALHRMAFARLSPWALQRFRLGAHSVRVEVPVQGVMELPTVQANEHASTNPSTSNSVFSNLQG